MNNEMIGKRFGKLVVKEYHGKKGRAKTWLCLCDCGNTRIVKTAYLNDGTASHCGCGTVIDLKGQRFGRLTVVELKGTINKKAVWTCKCDCGNTIDVQSYYLRDGTKKSCGCLQNESRSKSMKKAQTVHTFDELFVPFLKKDIQKNNTTGVKGVTTKKYKDKTKYMAQLGYKGKNIYLGIYDTLEKAIEARLKGEELYYGKAIQEYDEKFKKD
ncbi:hypothetical protein [Robertmurraya andreesenii]|uniref:AP2 domain protein n=1 Tax=Anoxybacillus andreesenii TaxID=1325932 RepID=A0ABT9V1U5_9BACL|nr:hypothetical protein [Robertmurraya andreesenii]MDQ0154927.1 hypothetical protein [Robertmurraya andreesenii]